MPASEGATELIVVDFVDGEGAELVEGQTAVLDFVLFRGDNGVPLESSWGNEPLQIPMIETEFLSGLVDGMLGMNVGGLPGLESPKGFVGSVVIMIIAAAGLVAFFRWKKWL